MKYKLHIPFGTRLDLLEEALGSVRDIGNIHLWADGIPCPDYPDVVKHEPGLVTIVSLINMCIKESWDDDVMFLAHNDMYAKPGIAKRFFDLAQNKFESDDKKWGIMFSHYDVLCAFNMAAVREVGYWDTMYFQYRADVDYYHTLKQAGWHEVQTGLDNEIIHHGSQTVKSDPLYNYRTRFRNSIDFDGKYYRLKWGGDPGQEKFSQPWQDFKPDQPHFRYMPVRPHPMLRPKPHPLVIHRPHGNVKA